MDEAKRTFFSLAEVFPGLAIALGVVGLEIVLWRYVIRPAIELGMRLESRIDVDGRRMESETPQHERLPPDKAG